MPIIRARHSFDANFTTVPNEWVRDSRISLKAKGLLVQLMSHSVGWTVTVATLATANGCGRDTIRSAVLELETAGYLIRTQARDASGQFDSVIWETNDPSENPMTENPTTVNPTLKKTKSKEDQVKEDTPQPAVEGAFVEFWNLYPRKTEKADARHAFTQVLNGYTAGSGRNTVRLDPVDIATILEGVRRLANDPNLPPKQFIPYPASWLRSWGWTNEPYPPREKSKEERIAEERKALAERAERDKLRAAEAREREKREAEAFVPPPRCEHGRLLVRCPTCKDTPDVDGSGTE